MGESAPPPPRVTRLQLFLAFAKVGLLGFGGVSAWARRVVVEERRWLDDADYVRVVAVGQILPGANTANVAIMIGDRFHGAAGALIAMAGLTAMPLAILMALATLYQRFAEAPDVKAAIAGTAAAAAGMVIGTALKIARRLRPTRVAIAFGIATFILVGLLRIPLLVAVAVLAPLSVAAVVWLERPR